MGLMSIRNISMLWDEKILLKRRHLLPTLQNTTYLKAILPIEGQRIIFLNFALYFYKTIVESIALVFYFHARYFYVEIKRNIKIKFALYYYGCRSMDPLICSAKKCILCSILQQSLVEVWRIDMNLIDQKSIEIFLIDISPIGKSIVEVLRWPPLFYTIKC